MKCLFKIFLIGICILTIATPFSPAKETQTISTAAQVQPSSVFDITYAVFIWTPISTIFNPRYIDQFEFKSGDVFSAYTTKRGELTGEWIESLIGNGTWFQAWVAKKETTTTTSTSAETTTTTPAVQSTGSLRLNPLSKDDLKFDINIWGISFNYTPPAPFNTLTFSTILGYGAYLGADAFFIGFANIPSGITCNSIDPTSAEQGDTLTITIGCTNANFLKASSIEVGFIPSNGITVVGNPSVTNANEITVSIEIAADAEISERQVSITIDGVLADSPNLKFNVLRNTT